MASGPSGGRDRWLRLAGVRKGFHFRPLSCRGAAGPTRRFSIVASGVHVATSTRSRRTSRRADTQSHKAFRLNPASHPAFGEPGQSDPRHQSRRSSSRARYRPGSPSDQRLASGRSRGWPVHRTGKSVLSAGGHARGLARSVLPRNPPQFLCPIVVALEAISRPGSYDLRFIYLITALWVRIAPRPS
jgi:hypothetical protein